MDKFTVVAAADTWGSVLYVHAHDWNVERLEMQVVGSSEKCIQFSTCGEKLVPSK